MDQMTDWHRADIIAALHKKGTSLARVARQAGLRPSTLRNALDRCWPKGEQLIASALGVPPAAIWPTRYQHRNKLLSERQCDQNTAPPNGAPILSI